MNRLNSNDQIVLLLILIILAGLSLRCWNAMEIPFTFDELSAMSRTQFDSFKELIRVGVIEKDSHPAGIQVFLYYWVMFFNEREIVVKLPFIIAGLVSIYLVYRIGELWFGKTTGILTAAYLSSLQLFVMYSQIARPYVSGLFFTLAATFFWSKYFFKSANNKHLIGFIIFSTLAAYNHYFSLLYVAILGFSGLLLIKRRNLLAYVLSGMAILLLYTPHMPVILAQAEKGTIGGWLGTPGPYFLSDFLFWLFHHSYLAIGVLIFILLVGYVLKKRIEGRKQIDNKKRWMLFLWLLPAPVFGYIYSYTKEPILQYSLLIFTTPYLFLLLFSFVGEWKKSYLGLAAFLIIIVNTLTLIFNQDYYRNFYKQPFNQLIKNAVTLETDNDKEVFIINNYIPYYSEYYFRKYDKVFPYYTSRNQDVSLSEFKDILSRIEQDVVITSGLDDIYFQVILEQFPYWEGFETGFTYEQYIFSKDTLIRANAPGRQLISETTFKNNEPYNWKYTTDNITFDSISDSYSYLMKPDELYGPKVELPLKNFSDDIYCIVDVEAEIMTTDPEINAVIVGEIKNNNELVHWQGADFSASGIKPSQAQKIFLTMDIQKAMSDNKNITNQLFRIYIWNRDHQEFTIKKIKIYFRPGNPGRYRL